MIPENLLITVRDEAEEIYPPDPNDKEVNKIAKYERFAYSAGAKRGYELAMDRIRELEELVKDLGNQM